jgi:ERCC4-type nuclease
MPHQLEFGDAMLTGHGPDGGTLSIGVEVKGVGDLLSSISTGRLGGTQIPGLLKSYDVVWLAVYGTVRPGPNNLLQVRRGPKWDTFKVGRRPVPWAYLEGALISYQLLATLQSKPLFVKWLYDIDEIAAWLAVLDHWLEKPWDRHKALSVFDQSRQLVAPPGMDPVEEQIARVAAALPAIGWDRAWKAARHFGSVVDMMGANEKEWEKIPGIGPVVAEAVVLAIQSVKRKRRT